MDKHPVEQGIEGVVKTYELLDRLRLGRDIVVRDDQFEREVLLDAARSVRSKKIRMSLLDTGRFEPSDIEWLVREKVRFYTSDETCPREAELLLILKACRASKSFLAYFHNGPLGTGGGAEGFSLTALRGLLSSGLDLHISNRVHGRDFGVLADLADNARKGKAWMAYYHHGPLAEVLPAVAARGVWIHFADRSLEAAGSAEAALETVRAARDAGSRAVIYITEGLPLTLLSAVFEAGAAVIFQTPPSDIGSLQRPLERMARKRKVPVRASYLQTAFLP
jgi:hypothetical protein